MPTITRTERTCLNCGKVFWCKPSKTGRYCSRECYDVKRANPPKEHQCSACGKAYTRPATRQAKFCSLQCRDAQPRIPVEDLFWAKVDKSGGPDACWPWLGGRTKGYGSFQVRRKKVYAQRFAWESVNGPMAPGMQGLHHCDNPPCCNPAHVFPGTNADNMADKVAKGRNRFGGNKLTLQIAITIREKWATGRCTYQGMASEYGVHRVTIWAIVHNKIWRE